jgi:hypothetical protein
VGRLLEESRGERPLGALSKPQIGEHANIELRAQALNVFNLTNFPLFNPGNGITTSLTVNSAFGQTTGAYRDLQNTKHRQPARKQARGVARRAARSQGNFNGVILRDA